MLTIRRVASSFLLGAHGSSPVGKPLTRTVNFPLLGHVHVLDRGCSLAKLNFPAVGINYRISLMPRPMAGSLLLTCYLLTFFGNLSLLWFLYYVLSFCFVDLSIFKSPNDLEITQESTLFYGSIII